MTRQRRSGHQPSLDDDFEPDRLGERYTRIEMIEGSPAVEIGRVHGMTSLSDLVGEGEYTGCKSLRMMK
jgi:hypothetical protein